MANPTPATGSIPPANPYTNLNSSSYTSSHGIKWATTGESATISREVSKSEPKKYYNITIRFPSNYTDEQKNEFLDKFSPNFLDGMVFCSEGLGLGKKVKLLEFNLNRNGLQKVTKIYKNEVAKKSKEVDLKHYENKLNIVTDNPNKKGKREWKHKIFMDLDNLWRKTFQPAIEDDDDDGDDDYSDASDISLNNVDPNTASSSDRKE